MNGTPAPHQPANAGAAPESTEGGTDAENERRTPGQNEPGVAADPRQAAQPRQPATPGHAQPTPTGGLPVFRAPGAPPRDPAGPGAPVSGVPASEAPRRVIQQPSAQYSAPPSPPQAPTHGPPNPPRSAQPGPASQGGSAPPSNSAPQGGLSQQPHAAQPARPPADPRQAQWAQPAQPTSPANGTPKPNPAAPQAQPTNQPPANPTSPQGRPAPARHAHRSSGRPGPVPPPPAPPRRAPLPPAGPARYAPPAPPRTPPAGPNPGQPTRAQTPQSQTPQSQPTQAQPTHGQPTQHRPAGPQASSAPPTTARPNSAPPASAPPASGPPASAPPHRGPQPPQNRPQGPQQPPNTQPPNTPPAPSNPPPQLVSPLRRGMQAAASQASAPPAAAQPVTGPPAAGAPVPPVAAPHQPAQHQTGPHQPVQQQPVQYAQPQYAQPQYPQPAVDPRPAPQPTPPPAEGKPGKKAKVKKAKDKPVAPQRAKKMPPSRPPKVKDKDAYVDLEMREIAGHLTFTRNDVTAWYHLPDVQWAFRGDKERTSIMLGIAAQYAALAGYRIHLRRTTRPYPAAQWAHRLNQTTPHPLPDVPGAPSWADHLEASQHKLHNTTLAEGEVYLGVVFQRRTMREQAVEVLNAVRKRGVGGAERARLEHLVSRFDEVLGAFGMQAHPVTARQLEWLVHRSVALCMPAPSQLSPVDNEHWETGDLLAFTEHTRRFRTRYGNTVRLVSELGDQVVERHVAVLTFGRMEELTIPERHEPWLHFHEQLPWSMELSSRIDVLGQGDALKSLEHKLLVIRSQQRDYHEHEMDPPAELERLAQRALDISDEMATGMDLDAARIHGWHRIAVGGRTEEECLKRVRAVADHYRNMRITVQHPKDQLRLIDEFIPGQPVANTGYLRRMPAKYFAAAMPQAAAAIGDRRGPVIGETCGTSRRPVMWDPHYSTEVRERSGLAVFVAEPGGGKSTLMGGIAYLAARRGIQTTILDPSGPLARLCSMPEFAPYSRVFNLTRGEPGTLAPYALIPTPRREHFPPGDAGAAEWRSGVAAARAERKALAQDICTMLLPPQVAKERSTPILLQRAARQVEPTEATSLDDLVAAVAEFGHEGAELAETLNDVRDMPLSRLFFGRSTGVGDDEAVLTVVTMAGLTLPDLTIDREYWQLEERMALPMLHLATAFTTRRAYGRGMSERKLVGLDETHFLSGWGSGRALFTRLARDSRKWNIAALAASQNPIDILGLDVQNLVSTVFVGRIAEDPEVAAQALRMLGVQRGVGYENTLAQLSVADTYTDARLGYREFVMRDVDGRVQKFRADLSYVPGLLEHLDTTANPLANEKTGEGAS